MSDYSDEYSDYRDEDYDNDFDNSDNSDMTIDIISDGDDGIDYDSDESVVDNNDQEELMEDDDSNGGTPTRGQSAVVVNQPIQAPEQPVTMAASTSTTDEIAITSADEKKENISAAQVDSENSCIICTEMWTNSEEHHVVSLKCGHLFGKSCIETWLAPSRGYNRCPQCNKPAKKRDIHKIFARCVKPLDTWERDETLAKVKVWEKKVKTLEEKLEKSETKYKLLLKENDNLKYQLISLSTMKNSKSSTSINANISKQISGKTGSFQIAHYRDLDVRECGGRLHCYSKIIEALAITVTNSSQNNPLFPKYGIKKVPLVNNGKPDMIFLHNKPIKDMVINQYDGTISSVSFDKTLKVTSLISKAVIATVNIEIDPWSVHLHASRPNLLYIGLKNGNVLLYDKRMLNQSMMVLTSNAKSPVVSLNTIEYGPNNNKDSALLVVQLDTCSMYRFDNQNDPAQGDYSVSKLPFEGKFASSHFDPKSGYSLLSCRPSQKHVNMTHLVLDFFMDGNRLSPDIVNILEGGKEQVHLSRSKVYTNPLNDECVLVCAGDESSNGAILWDSKRSFSKSVTTHQPVLDIEMIENLHYASSPIISCLSDNTVKLYKLS